MKDHFTTPVEAPILILRLYGLIIAAAPALSGCGPYPPSIASKADIDALPAMTESVRARSLPDTEIPSLTRLRGLTLLNFTSGFARKDITTGYKTWEAAITDVGLSKLAELKLPKLETLHLGYCKSITNAGLTHVAKMDSVTWLSLRGCPQITHDGLGHLLTMNNLTGLDLRNCAGITDRGLTVLEKKANWQQILLGGCPNVTAAGIAKLRAALPNARVDLRPE